MSAPAANVDGSCPSPAKTLYRIEIGGSALFSITTVRGSVPHLRQPPSRQTTHAMSIAMEAVRSNRQNRMTPPMPQKAAAE